MIISVHHCHVNNFRSGKKTVELRRRAVHLSPGTRVWIYSKLPRGTIELIGTVDEVVKASPANLWRKFGGRVGITKNEFSDYFQDSNLGSAILFREMRRLSPSVRLQKMRRVSSGFQPPQFLKFLEEGSPELNLLLASKRLPTRKKADSLKCAIIPRPFRTARIGP